MSMRSVAATAAGRMVHAVLHGVLHRAASQLPGRVALAIDPQVVAHLRRKARKGSVVVCGTNGKTTTTNILAAALEEGGARVLCNRDGANMLPGVASALLPGRTADWAVIEADELSSIHILPQLRPTYLVLLNLFRDQLDRSGEIDHVQDVIVRALAASPETTLVTCGDDPLCVGVAERARATGTDVLAFGIDEDLGLPGENLRFHDHEKLAHYAKAACDIEFLFPTLGWGEINGTHDRTDFDLSRHQEYSGQKMEYLDPYTGERYIPYIVESTYGLDRTVLALLCQAYDEEVVDEAKNDVRVVLHLKPSIAPIKAAVLPLSKKLGGKALEILDELSKDFMVDYDETGSIGKRYRRQDEIGTPYCITVDFDTVGDENTPADNAVTIRDRDTMEQVRVPIDQLKQWLGAHLA